MALCIDCKDYNYIVVEISLDDINDLLHQNITMRDIIIKQEKYWTIFSQENILNDVVKINNMQDINQNLLPKKGAYYQMPNYGKL